MMGKRGSEINSTAHPYFTIFKQLRPMTYQQQSPPQLFGALAAKIQILKIYTEMGCIPPAGIIVQKLGKRGFIEIMRNRHHPIQSPNTPLAPSMAPRRFQQFYTSYKNSLNLLMFTDFIYTDPLSFLVDRQQKMDRLPRKRQERDRLCLLTPLSS